MTATNRLIVTVLAAVAAAGAFYMFALKPKHQEASDLQAQIAKQQTALDSARQLLAANQQAREQYRAAYATVVRLGKAVPADDDVRSLVVQLEAAARRTHVDFRSIDVSAGSGGATAPTATTTTGSAADAVTLPPGATVGPAGFPVMPFTFSFKGSFFGLGSFFRTVEDFVHAHHGQLRVNGRLLTLDALQLQPDATGFPHMRATVNATSYLVSPLEGATGGATASSPSAATSAPATASPAPSATPDSSTSTTATTATATGAIR